jgi:hypothetical protein
MSKTIRRKNGHDLNYAIRDRNYTDTRLGGAYYHPCTLEGKERRQAIARYHSDMRVGWSAPSFDRKIEHASHRARASQEIVRYYKDDEYEVQILANPRWPYWI